MTTNIDIVNRALLQCGAREQIVSFTEGSVSANTANLLYQPTFEEIARSANWNCLRLQGSLTLLAAAQGTPENQTGTVLPIPPQPWLYEYLLPNDCLRVRYLVPTLLTQNTSVVGFPNAVMPAYRKKYEIPYVVSTDIIAGNSTKVILTNLETAQIVYTTNQANPDFWDSQFQAAYVAMLAAYLIPPLNLNLGLMGTQNKIAAEIIEQAKATDGNEGVISQNRDASWITARGAGREWLADSQGYGSYWPYGE